MIDDVLGLVLAVAGRVRTVAVDLSVLPLKEQLELVHSSCMMVGAHGYVTVVFAASHRLHILRSCCSW